MDNRIHLGALIAVVCGLVLSGAASLNAHDSIAATELDGDRDANLAAVARENGDVSVVLNQRTDCNENGIPDECDIDCDLPGCDVPGCGESEDCNTNSVPDECDLESQGGAGILFDLDDDPGWQTEGLWAWGQPTGGGGAHGSPDPTSGHTGLNVYGYNLDGDYESDLPERYLTTNPIDCSGLQDVHLTFRRWLGVEEPLYDRAYIHVSNDGYEWAKIWENAATIADDHWVFQDFYIAGVADGEPTVYVRWTMGPTDYDWQYCGWNIDDIEIYGDSAPVSSDCNDNGVPDECDIAGETSDDCNENGIPDECDMEGHDCCEIGHGTGCSDPAIEACVCAIDPYCCDVFWDATCAEEVITLGCGTCETDCNGNGVLDECDVADGTSLDCNANDIPDECEYPGCQDILPADMNCDDLRDGDDIQPFVSYFMAGRYTCQADMNQDGILDTDDVPAFVNAVLTG